MAVRGAVIKHVPLIILVLILQLVPAGAFFRHLCFGELGNGRVDPIMAPGQPSQHLHVSFGASNFGLDPTIDELLASNCTSCSIVQDHSAYWAPRMYFQHDNGTLDMVSTAGGMTVYYFTEPGSPDERVVAFPQNFRMIAGNSVKRIFYGPTPDPPMAQWSDSDRTQQSLMEKALGFNCLHYAAGYNEGSLEHHQLRDKAFMDATCTDGIRAELMFPSCWNGKDLDSDNHTTHVAYPSEVKYGQCPDGYPVKLPILFYETIYRTNEYAGVDGRFTFSNGDPTGNGYHGDFICGWDDGVLQQAIDNPTCTGPQSDGVQEHCTTFTIQGQDAAVGCKMEVPEAIQGEAINHVQELPGNVPINADPPADLTPSMAATSSSTSAPATTLPSSPPSPAPTATPGPTAAAPVAGPGASAAGGTVTDPAVANAQVTVTTTYISDGVEIHMVLVEEVVTVTVVQDADADADANHRKRHQHARAHGHVHGN